MWSYHYPNLLVTLLKETFTNSQELMAILTPEFNLNLFEYDNLQDTVRRYY